MYLYNIRHCIRSQKTGFKQRVLSLFCAKAVSKTRLFDVYSHIWIQKCFEIKIEKQNAVWLTQYLCIYIYIWTQFNPISYIYIHYFVYKTKSMYITKAKMTLQTHSFSNGLCNYIWKESAQTWSSCRSNLFKQCLVWFCSYQTAQKHVWAAWIQNQVFFLWYTCI